MEDEVGELCVILVAQSCGPYLPSNALVFTAVGEAGARRTATAHRHKQNRRWVSGWGERTCVICPSQFLLFSTTTTCAFLFALTRAGSKGRTREERRGGTEPRRLRGEKGQVRDVCFAILVRTHSYNNNIFVLFSSHDRQRQQVRWGT